MQSMRPTKIRRARTRPQADKQVLGCKAAIARPTLPLALYACILCFMGWHAHEAAWPRGVALAKFSCKNAGGPQPDADPDGNKACPCAGSSL